MKPLELRIHEKHPHADAYRVGGFYSPYALVSTEKRFSDAELAAEYWSTAAMYWSAQANDDEFDIGRLKVMQSFATHNHHDEES